jgi:glycosyltransferase involved in cell wall biosynthesis
VALPNKSAADARSQRPRLYVFSPLPPQRNGLADYIVEYLTPLARDFELLLVAENGSTADVKAHFDEAYRGAPPFAVISESMFAARQPDAGARMLYNVGNNGDCSYLLDYLHRYPGVVMLHDVSLFYLHQITLQAQRANGFMASWLEDEGFAVPDYFLNPDGSLGRSPGLLYQECLMVRRVVRSASALIVHSRYARQRVMGAVHGAIPADELKAKVSRIPHFVLPLSSTAADEEADTLARYGIRPTDHVLLCPGFLTGNKMLYELLVAYRRLQHDIPGLKLVYAGEERPDEYPISAKIAQLWPDGSGPVVTGYLTSNELDILLARADVSFVLRYPTYGETSGILPRAVMGGAQVVTVDIGSYPEFDSPLIRPISVGTGAAQALEISVRDLWASRGDRLPKPQLRMAEARRASALTPQSLYRRIGDVIRQSPECRA